jgi:hypothetical protein
VRTRIAVARALASVLLLAGCGQQQPRGHATYGLAGPPGAATRNSAWKKVINDWWFDGGIDHPHSCAAVREAVAHLPMSTMYSTVRPDLQAYERKVC